MLWVLRNMKSKTLILLSFLFLINNCKDPVSLNEDFTSPSSILSFFSDKDEFTYYRTVTESNGIDEVWIEKSVDIWKVSGVIKDSLENWASLEFEVSTEARIELITCDGVNFENCITTQRDSTYQSTASYYFNSLENRILIEIPNELLNSYENSKYYNNLEENLTFDYLFSQRNSDELQITTNENGFSLSASYQPLEVITNLDISRGDKCGFWSFEMIQEEKSNDPDLTSLKGCNDVNQIKNSLQNLFSFQVEDIISFERTMGAYVYEFQKINIYQNSTKGDELIVLEDWDFKSNELWRVQNLNFDDVNVIYTIEFDIEISSFSSSGIDTSSLKYSNFLKNYSAFLILDYKKNIIRFDYEENQLYQGQKYVFGPNSVDIFWNLSFSDEDNSNEVIINKGLTTFIYIPNTKQFSLESFIPRTSNTPAKEWWFTLNQ